ncbi:MAG TPA: ABC transporter permease [Candidatus Acidoferrales bacterium]|nr:ABC transporter permease [Candidatus Acidoferrales bacterium]
MGHLTAQPWVQWDWLGRHWGDVLQATLQHLELTGVAVGVGLSLSLPLGVLAHRHPPLRGLVLGIAGALYTVPSLALFALLIPFTGLSIVTAEVGLVSYTLLILIRNIVVGLDGVPAEVLDAARGMGYRPRARLIRVELPLAIPAIISGLRVATVTTVGLVTITALLGLGGLGQLILQGLVEDFRTPLLVGTLGSVALAVLADLGLAEILHSLAPWSRA